MIVFFRKFPLTIKLLLISIIPILFLIYFSVLIYIEKSQRVKLIGDHIESIDQSANIGELINQLGRERKYSYQFTIKKTGYDEVLIHRIKTDSIIHILEKSRDLALADFTKYTFLNNLGSIRKAIDTTKNLPQDTIVQFYTDVIIRLNTLNSAIPSSNAFLQPLYQDLIAQKILSEMITFLGIIRNNIFNALYTGKYMTETLLGSFSIYKIYQSYETEFLLKASPATIRTYNNRKKLTDYNSTIGYMNKLFTTFKFDSTYDADQWWNASTEGIKVLRKQQLNLWKSVDTRMKTIYQHEDNSKNVAIIFLLIAILFVIIFVAYSINDITKLLRELKLAARKMSKGGTGLQLKNMPYGVIGTLAKSIEQIDKNNLLLANAANEIGKGNFDVEVKPRSDEDLLGISIKKMKHSLRELTSQKDKVQQETLELVNKRDEFFSVASHELKTPITSLKAYTQLLQMDVSASNDLKQTAMLEKMDAQINKLTSLINDLLDTSKLQNNQLVYIKHPFKFNEMVAKMVADIQSTTSGQELIIKANPVVDVNADRDRIGQVLKNILVNAIKYARDSGQIIVEVHKKDDKVICSVQDFGGGISPDQQGKIFERYYRISGNNLHTYPGLGLGLYISKEIIERHEGKIWVQSEKGNGSTFYFELPVFKALI